jgi:hypothetical protein
MAYFPAKYFKGLSTRKTRQRKGEITRRAKMSFKSAKAYVPFQTDKGVKTRKSSYTERFHKKYPGVTSMPDIAKATGISKSVLEKVYDRGMAAWRTGHRPGASQQAWGKARVYSFALKGKTYRTADKDLAKKGGVTMKNSDYLREHHHLSKVLAHPAKKSLAAELKKQKQELKERGMK